MPITACLSQVEKDDPTRCQAVLANGQCRYKAVEGGQFCLMHGGNKQIIKNKQAAMRNYRFQKYQQRISELADNDAVKSLREEIGVLRVLLEETVNRCSEDNDILIYAPKISDLVIKIEKLVTSCHRLESSLGSTLDKTVVLNMATSIVNIVGELIPDEEILQTLVGRIGDMLCTPL